MENETYKIRPAGRHLETIGSELIQNESAAIIELVKNSYDADASNVAICFKVTKQMNLMIEIEDDGHGMDRDTVLTKWLVPSTSDKSSRRISPTGRIMQGRKGIGRYAASVLGRDLLLETKVANRDKSTVYMDWSQFSDSEYLDQVDVLVDSFENNNSKSGTKLTIEVGKNYATQWNDAAIDKLVKELKKLTSPITLKSVVGEDDSGFEISVRFIGYYYKSESDYEIIIEPFPIQEFYDYRISGELRANTDCKLEFTNQRAKNTVTEEISIQTGSVSCGKLIVDIRVYDREPAAIENLVKKGLKDDSGNYLGKLDAKRLLNESNGVGVYRNGFRIRPMGDPDFDWLKLNFRRVQEPSVRIGSNQVIGFVLIESEESSGLYEKSARDGLKENTSYTDLFNLVIEVISELESKRFAFRKKSGLGRDTLKLESSLESIFNYDDVKLKIRKRLESYDEDGRAAKEIVDIIEAKEESINKLANSLRNTIAIYQGQATLGKIINVVLHEGRRPLNFFNNQIDNIDYYLKKFREKKSLNYLDKTEELLSGWKENTTILRELFSKIDPLAQKSRGKAKNFKVRKAILAATGAYSKLLEDKDISLEINCEAGVISYGFEQDLLTILLNLIDNSTYWLEKKREKDREITINVNGREKFETLDFRDNGPGIEKSYLDSNVIFEPEFTTKPEGAGIGLAIAGEAAHRTNLELLALESDVGAYFRIQKMEDENES